MLISYNWLKSYIPEVPEVDKLTELITFKLCELESVEKLPNGDTVFDLKILPDRAHDLLSHRGVAYEIAGMLGLRVSENSSSNSFPQVLGSPRKEIGELGQTSSEKNNSSELSEKDNSVALLKTQLQIEIQTPSCKRYMGRIVRGVKVGTSPVWMVKYLESVGQRSINNIVDATNIILFGIGQPIHAFDLKRLDGEKIVVKNAKDGDELELVGSEKLKAKLRETDMMITDGVKNLAIAGVKGGLDSGINNDTTDILIEVASFDAVSVRKTARRLGIQTDASKRYENDLSSTLCDFAMMEISSLLKELCPEVEFEEVVDVYNIKQEERKVSFSADYISKVLGVKIPDEEIEKILNNYNYEFSHRSDLWEIRVPDLRLDITGAHDMVEEIGRVYGYDKIIPQLPDKIIGAKDNDIWTKICLAKNKLINDGYREVYNYALTDKGDMGILASASDKSFLRNNLLDGLKKSYELNRLNAPLLGTEEIKLFEVGTIFTKDGEEMHVAYLDKKNQVEMELDLFIKEKVSQDIHSEITHKILLNFCSARSVDLAQGSQDEHPATLLNPRIFKSWSSYPFMTRDIAVWVPEGTDSEILKNIYKEFGGELLLEEPKLFDSFTKPSKVEGEKARTSYAYHLVFQSYSRTLTDEEINKIMNSILEKIQHLGFEAR